MAVSKRPFLFAQRQYKLTVNHRRSRALFATRANDSYFFF
jgi:hypothetical protein